MDGIRAALGDDEAATVCHILNARGFNVGLRDGLSTDDAPFSHEVPERVLLAEDDEKLIVLQLAGDLLEIRRRQVAPAQLFAGLIVPSVVFGHSRGGTTELPTTKAK